MSLLPIAATAASLAPEIINGISSLLPSSNASANPVPSTDRVVLDSQALPPSPPLPLSPSVGPRSASVTQPFIFKYYGLTGTESKIASTTVSSLEPVRTIIAHFRDAELLSLEAVVFPTSYAMKAPITCELAWTPADITLTAANISSTPGYACVTAGGPFLLQSNVLVADLGYLNPIVKSPIPYTNHPRLNISFWQNPEGKSEGVSATIKANVFIRGLIRVSHPICAPY